MGLSPGETWYNLGVGKGFKVEIKRAENIRCAEMPGLFCSTTKKMKSKPFRFRFNKYFQLFFCCVNYVIFLHFT